MKTKIFYFSATGNTESAAKLIASKLESAEAISIVGQNVSTKAEDADIVGIFFPVYAMAIPKIVRRFVSQLKIKQGAYVFALATYGGTDMFSKDDCINALKNNNNKLNAFFSLKYPDNYVPFFNKASDEEIKNTIIEAEKKIPKIVKIIKQKIDLSPKPNFLKSLMAKNMAFIQEKFFTKADKNFRVSDKCNACGLCVKLCPVSNIKIENSKPIFKHKCEHCFACLHHCPQAAISWKNKLWQYRYQ